jgi:hypothetical protein
MDADFDLDRAEKIAAINDSYRQNMPSDVMLTRGVRNMVVGLPGLMKAIQQFNTFDEDNDPWREHDFGSLVWNGNKVFWKIDYYDQELKFGQDPLSPECRRVMTVMLASEY